MKENLVGVAFLLLIHEDERRPHLSIEEKVNNENGFTVHTFFSAINPKWCIHVKDDAFRSRWTQLTPSYFVMRKKSFLKGEVINLNQIFLFRIYFAELEFRYQCKAKKHVDNIKSDTLLQYENMVDLYKTYLYQTTI